MVRYVDPLNAFLKQSTQVTEPAGRRTVAEMVICVSRNAARAKLRLRGDKGAASGQAGYSHWASNERVIHCLAARLRLVARHAPRRTKAFATFFFHACQVVETPLNNKRPLRSNHFRLDLNVSFVYLRLSAYRDQSGPEKTQPVTTAGPRNGIFR